MMFSVKQKPTSGMNFLDGLAETTNRAFCSVLGGFANQAELLQYVLTPGFGTQYNPFPLLYAQNCPTNPIPVPEPPFDGGQCSAVNYRVSGTSIIRYSGGASGAPFANPQAFSADVLGPVQGARFVDNGSSVVVRVIGSTQANGTTTSGITPPDFGKFTYTDIVVTSIQRLDGLPDNCGNPPANIPPYTPGGNVHNDNVTYNNNLGVSVSIPVSLTLGYASVNIDGTVSIPINARFSANPQFNGNFNFNLNTGGVQPDFSNPNAPINSPCSDPSGYSPDPSLPPPPSSIPNADPIPPATPQPTQRQKLLKGCIVTTQVLDGNESIIFQEDNPDLYVPSLGYVQFLVRVAGASAWTNDLPVKCLRTFIPCPWDAGAIDVRGTPRYGNEFIITPVYVTRTFNPTYPPES